MAKGFLLPALALVVSASRGVLSAPATGMTTNVATSYLDSPTPSEAENKQVAQAEHFPSIAAREERVISFNLDAVEKVAGEAATLLAKHHPEFKQKDWQAAEEYGSLYEYYGNWLGSLVKSSKRASGTPLDNGNRLADEESLAKMAKTFTFLSMHDTGPAVLRLSGQGKVDPEDLVAIAKDMELIKNLVYLRFAFRGQTRGWPRRRSTTT